MLCTGVIDRDCSFCQYSRCDQTSYIEMIRNDCPVSTMKSVYSLDGESVASDTGNLRSHTHEHIAQVLSMRLTRCIIDLCCSFGHDSHQDQILSPCH